MVTAMKNAISAVRAFLVTALPHDGPTSFLLTWFVRTFSSSASLLVTSVCLDALMCLNCTRRVLIDPDLATWIFASAKPSDANALRASDTILLSDWCDAAGTSQR